MTPAISGWERSMAAADAVRDRLRRASAALESHGIPYAVIGGNAVAEWVGRVDAAAVRTTADVDILLNRTDLEAAKIAMESAGFVYRHAASIDMFLDGPDAKARDAVHVIFAGEKVRREYLLPTPQLSESEAAQDFRVLSLEALVRMKLTSFRDKDRTHLRDFIDIGTIDETWPAKLPPELAARLQELLNTPDG
jgi:Uncharacterised nucleotidyltransferase